MTVIHPLADLLLSFQTKKFILLHSYSKYHIIVLCKVLPMIFQPGSKFYSAISSNHCCVLRNLRIFKEVKLE